MKESDYKKMGSVFKDFSKHQEVFEAILSENDLDDEDIQFVSGIKGYIDAVMPVVGAGLLRILHKQMDAEKEDIAA